MPSPPAIAIPPITVPIIAQRKIFARDDGIEGHDAGVDESEQRRDGVEGRKLARGKIAKSPERLDEQSHDQDMLGSKAIPEQAKRDAAAEASQPFHAIDRHGNDQRYAASHGIAHGVEDRA